MQKYWPYSNCWVEAAVAAAVQTDIFWGSTAAENQLKSFIKVPQKCAPLPAPGGKQCPSQTAEPSRSKHVVQRGCENKLQEFSVQKSAISKLSGGLCSAVAPCPSSTSSLCALWQFHHSLIILAPNQLVSLVITGQSIRCSENICPWLFIHKGYWLLFRKCQGFTCVGSLKKLFQNWFSIESCETGVEA